jgi:hypothetical protein
MEDKKEEKPKRGRPAKEKEKLNFSINLKLTGKDFGLIKEKAKGLGMKTTRYVREMVLKGGVKSRFTLEELDLMRKLSGIANNLNQITKLAHQRELYMVTEVLIEIIDQIKNLFHDR